MRRSMHRGALAVLAIVLWGWTAGGQDTSALINKALDEQVKLTLNTSLPRALKEITDKTGVRFEVQPVVWDLLPWGEDTKISAKIENQTLREALTLMMRKLGLTFSLREEAVEIRPMPALRRLARRSTPAELHALDVLATTPLGLATDRPAFRQLLEAVDLKLAADPKAQVAIENRAGDSVRPEQTVMVARNATLMDALDALARQTPATWYPWGKSILVVTRQDQFRQQLARRISVDFKGVDVMQVLLELQARAGVPFDFQPGAIQRIPTDSRSIRAHIVDASIQQVLEALSGSTGLVFTTRDDAVYVSNPAAERDPMLGIIQLDIGFQVMVPRSQVPADIREYLQHKMRKEFDRIRRMMEDEGYKPATQPATRPAEPTGRDL